MKGAFISCSAVSNIEIHMQSSYAIRDPSLRCSAVGYVGMYTMLKANLIAKSDCKYSSLLSESAQITRQDIPGPSRIQ